MERTKEFGMIENLRFWEENEENVEMTHLLFADDTIFLVSDDDQNWANLNMVLESVCLLFWISNQ